MFLNPNKTGLFEDSFFLGESTPPPRPPPLFQEELI